MILPSCLLIHVDKGPIKDMFESSNLEVVLPDGHSEQNGQGDSEQEEKGEIASRASKKLQWWIRREARHWRQGEK